MLRREPWRLLFPLGTVLAWLGVLPWLLFALGLRGAYEPLYSTLGYRSFFHPLAELEGFLACFGAGLLFTLLRPGPAPWQVAVAAGAPVASAALGAAGQWELGQAATLVLLVVALQFWARRVRASPDALWIVLGLLLGAAGAVLGRIADARGSDWFWVHELGRDLVMQGMFAGVAIGAARMLRGDPSEPRPGLLALHALSAMAFAASFWVGPRFGQHLGLALRALAALAMARPLRPGWEFGPANLRRGFAHLALWLLAFGLGWAAVALAIRRAGLHVVFLGSFAALLMAAFTELRTGSRRLLALTAALLALSMMGRVMVELDPTSFHLWMGISASAFLLGTVACAVLPLQPAAPAAAAQSV